MSFAICMGTVFQGDASCRKFRPKCGDQEQPDRWHDLRLWRLGGGKFTAQQELKRVRLY
jgi:hypothetical protein